MILDEIQRKALELDPSARAKLAHDLVVSLENLSPSEIDQLWVDESERRLAEMESGKVAGIPGDQVFARLRERLK